MLNRVRVFFRGEFNRNVLTLMTGTGLAQLIPLAVTPILSRIYSPEQFGVLALFVAVVSSLSVLATGRYEMAIMLPRKNADATNIAALSITINLVVSVALFAVACLFNKPISDALGNGSISTWLYFVPLAVLLNGIYLNLNYWSNRNKLYFLMAHRRVLHSGGSSAVQLGLGLLRAGAGGLVVGSLSGQALAAGMMANMVRRHSPQLWRGIDRRKMWALAKRYKSCPQFLVPAHTLGALSIQLPAIFINTTFGLAASGFYMLAERVVGTPLSLVSASIGDVFRQEISECYLAGKHCRKVFISTFKKLAAVATPPFLVLLFFAPPLFALVFGEKWRVSGEYVQLMCPMFYLRFISNPLSLVAIIAQKNRFEFLWQLGMLIFLVLAAVSHHFIQLNEKLYVLAFVIICGTFDLVNLLASYKFARDGDLRNPGGPAR
jgi:O-antigen/teichoic acid export membrane protein